MKIFQILIMYLDVDYLNNEGRCMVFVQHSLNRRDVTGFIIFVFFSLDWLSHSIIFGTNFSYASSQCPEKVSVHRLTDISCYI